MAEPLCDAWQYLCHLSEEKHARECRPLGRVIKLAG